MSIPLRTTSSPVQLRLPVAIIALSAVAFGALGVVAVQQISDLTRDNVQQGVLDLVTLRAREIAAFFEERGRVATTVFADPLARRWIAEYTTFRRPLEGDPGWEHLLGEFRFIEEHDPTITAVFFATAATGEYFRSLGRVEREGYDTRTRWWWHEAVDTRRPHVTAAGVDAGTGELGVTIQMTLDNPDGSVLAVAGLDVNLETLGGLVDAINHQGVGNAFLVDAQSRIIYFPAIDFSTLPRGDLVVTSLGMVDQLYPDTSGFAELADDFVNQKAGLARVRWRGEPRFVAHMPVHSERPELRWTLGLAVPEQVISSPIAQMRWRAAIAILLAVLAIAGVTLAVTHRVDSQLRVADRLRAAALAEANARLLETDQMKSRFLATMSHELRTPLNSIIGFSSILRTRLSDQLDQRYLKFLDNIRSSGEHLLAMISDILDLSKVEAGRLELHPETVHIPELIDNVCDILRASARDRTLELECLAARDLPPIEADPIRLKQILLNLIANALKFAYEGTAVQITARALDADGSPLGVPALALAVADRGIGIAPADQKVIFEEFRQVFQSDGRTYGGTGLGLALVRRLVELHHGLITVQSVLGEGSTFTVVLPRERGDERPQPTASPTVSVVEGTRVLVVEDDTAAFERIRHDLAGAGYTVLWSRTGDDAVELATDHQPAAIVLDIVLPGRDGWDILRDLKARSDTAPIPVIIVSMLANHELGLALGADAYFTKPVDRAQLLARIAELIPPAITTPPRVLLVDDEPSLHELVEEMLRGQDYELMHAYSGAEGLDLARREHPDVIILDLMMPGIDGFEVATWLRSDPGTCGIPIIVLTARDTTRAERERLRGKIEVLLRKGEAGTTRLAPLIRNLVEQKAPASRQGNDD